MEVTRDINEYVENLLRDKAFLKKEYAVFVDNTYSIEGLDGVIAAEILCRAIQKARKSEKWRAMLGEILFYADKNSVTPENFEMLLKFGNQDRANFLFALEHCDLSFYQMMNINKSISGYESFAFLLDRMCESNVFTVNDIEFLIYESRDVTKCGVEKCIKYAEEKYGASEKIEAAKRFCEKMKGM